MLTHSFDERGEIEKRVSDANVAPIEDHRRVVRPPSVPRMEVAVHEGVGHAAGAELGEPVRKVTHESGEQRSESGWRSTFDDVDREVHEALGSPVRCAERDGFVDAVDPGCLQGHECVDHCFQLRQLSVVAVVAGDVGEQHPAGFAGDELRHGSVLTERTQHCRLVSEERRDVLEPHETLIGRDLPDRREVPRPDLRGFSGDAHMSGSPVEVRRRPARSCVRRAQGVIVQLAHPRRKHGARVAAHELGEVGGRRLERSLAFEQAQDRDVEAEAFSHCGDDRLGLLPPRRLDGERGQRAPRVVEDDGDDAGDRHLRPASRARAARASGSPS